MTDRLLFSAQDSNAKSVAKKFRTLLIIAFVVCFMHGCSMVDDSSLKPAPQKVVLITPESGATKLTELEALQAQIDKARLANNWNKWLPLSESLWEQVAPSQQIAIEMQMLETLKQLPSAQLNAIQTQANATKNQSLLDWISLVDIENRPAIWRNTGYENLALFNETALYHHHLIAHLKQQLNTPKLPSKIAVFLPFQGPYAKVSEQIRNGILKYQMTHAPQLSLSFHDSSSNPTLLVQSAKKVLADRTDWVLGPLTKESIIELANHLTPEEAQHFWALNSVNNTPFKQMSFGSHFEALTIVQKLHHQGYQSISVLTSDQPNDSKLAEQIQQLWLGLDTRNQVTLTTFPEKNPNLRKALGEAINENTSQDRVNNLNWLFRDKLVFNPRPRQDLNAMVVLADEQTLAVFKPQMKFFELTLPIYASSKLTPTHFTNAPLLKDLQGVNFPTMSVALQPKTAQTNPETPFEAFGWDSLLILMSQHQLAPNMCLNNGKTGRLSFDDDQQRVERELVWGTYTARGQLIPRPFPKSQLLSDAPTPNSLMAIKQSPAQPPAAEPMFPNKLIKPAAPAVNILPLMDSPNF